MSKEHVMMDEIEETKYDRFLKREGKKSLTRIFSKLNEDVPMHMTVTENGESSEAPISDVMVLAPVVEPGAKFNIQDLSRDGSPVTPYDMCIAARGAYDAIFRGNLQRMLTSFDDESICGVKQSLSDYKEMLMHLISHDKDIVMGFLTSNINKLTISAVIEFFRKIYENEKDERKVKAIQCTLDYIIRNDNELFYSLFMNKDTSPKAHNYGGYHMRVHRNPTLDSHHSFDGIMYNNGRIENETLSVNSFMGMAESKITYTAGELTANLYDKLFVILSKIELTTHGLADLGYEWIMESLDKTGYDILADYHDSLVDMLRFTIMKVNAIYYTHGTYVNLWQEINSLLNKAERKYGNLDDDDYYE